MTQFSYTHDAWVDLIKKPEDRSAPLKALAEAMGGKLIGLYYCFGEYDGVAFVEGPDDITHISSVLAVIAPGHVKTTKTTKLFTVDEMVEALEKAGAFTYQAPGG
jgi:uncharacterized protein with GYD domain